MCLSWGIEYWQPLSAGEDTSIGEAFMNDLAQQTSAAVPCHPGMRRTWYFIHSQEYDADALAALDESIVEVIRDDMIKLDGLVRSTIAEGGTPGPERPIVPAKAPENLILYGPPGTGKTYATVYEALRLCAVEEPESREAAMETFKELRDRGRIEFVTFHQSFSYEEFVEGIRPEVDEDTKTVSYECRDGVFRKIVKSAMQNVSQRAAGYEFDESQIRFWKMSLGNTLDDRQAMIYEQCVDQNYILLGYGEELDFADCKTRQAVHKHLLTVKPDATSSDYAVTSVNLLVNQMEIGDIVIVSDGNAAFRAIGKITGEYRRLTEGGAYGQARDVEWLVVFDESLPRELIFEKHISQMSLYQLKPETLKLDTLRDLIRPQQSGEVLPHVLIIDEINRGNLSKIFGELITLLEPDKRIGAANELRVKLPYSNDDFGVPSNLSVLATMNTADRSIALMDVALRRRFTFRELMPDPSVLEDCMPNGTVLSDVDVPQLLECINLRIQFLYDRDHTIGHSYFVHVDSLDSLRGVLINRVIPLLQEYFYEDWEKICLVLGCRCDLDSGTQGNTHPLIKAKRLVEKEILGFDHDDYDDQFNYLVNPDFVEAEANELAKFFTNILVSIGPVAPE
jgi:5-methylcytosine-specific restriction protein B